MKKITLHAAIVALFISMTAFVVTGNQKNSEALVKVKVASLQACGSTEPTIALVKETAKELNLQIDFEYVPVKTIEEARKHRHLGSPTIQINGLDIDPAARSIERFGIS